MARIILIGVRDNKGFEMILEPEKPNDDEAEAKLIQEFFNDGLVSITAFKNAIQDLKTLVFNT